jgi:F0F1-type ATP synthase assembly protein I
MSSAAAKHSDHSDDKPAPSDKKSDKSAAILLFATAADTTWRMFVPTLGGTLIGLWLDGTYHTEPWYSIGGLIMGIIITALLVRQQ